MPYLEPDPIPGPTDAELRGTDAELRGPQEVFISLENLCRGAAIERFNEELQKVLRNIVDPNTPARAKRCITLKVVIAPSEERDFATIAVTATSKTADPMPVTTSVMIGSSGGLVGATELSNRHHQPRLPGI
ncbi:MAG TPA: hypothetical protein V6D06_01435 [Trichocoleus sp.]